MNVLTLKQAAAFVHVHPKTLRAMAASGKIPANKFGKNWRFLDIHLTSYLAGDYENIYQNKMAEDYDLEFQNISRPAKPKAAHRKFTMDISTEYERILGIKI